MDNLTKEQRKRNMQHIKSKNTSIELKLCKALYKSGFHYYKNYGKLPGKPDIVLPRDKIAIFCDSEFFHGKVWEILKKRLESGVHSEYWIKKIDINRKRDIEVNKQLSFMGWLVIRFWEKEINKNTDERVRAVKEAIWDRKIYYLDNL